MGINSFVLLFKVLIQFRSGLFNEGEDTLKIRSILLAAFAVCACLLLSYGNARAEMASASVLVNTCFSCHGTDGKSLGAMPSINGKEAKYIETSLMAFRSGKKPSTVMKRIAKGFSDDEIRALARLLSSIK